MDEKDAVMDETRRPMLVRDPVPAAVSAGGTGLDEPNWWPVLRAPESRWPELAMGIWELRAARSGDCHPYDEVNYVLAGTLVVECDGSIIEAGPGDTIRVPGGLAAFYSAPEYARMLYVYGPNPEGRPSTTLAYGDTTS